MDSLMAIIYYFCFAPVKLGNCTDDTEVLQEFFTRVRGQYSKVLKFAFF